MSTSFLANWKSLVSDAETDTETLSWVQSVQNSGSCCGWLDSGDATENPSWLSCPTSNPATCSTYFRSSFGSQFGNLEVVAISLSAVQLALVSTTYALICRLKEFYKSEDIDYGDYVHVPFGKVRSIDDLL